MANDNNIKKTVDMIIAVGAAGAAAVVGASHIMEKFSKKEKGKNNAPLLLESPQTKEYVDNFCKTFFLHDLIGSKRIRGAVIKLIEIEDYDSAVRKACILFLTTIKEKSGLTIDGQKLIDTAFDLDNPILKFTNLTSQKTIEKEKYIIYLFKNIVQIWRNPVMHDELNLSEAEAIRQIALISYATEIVENNTIRVRK